MEEFKNIFKKVFLQNYANFKGRATRREYWIFTLIYYLISMVLMSFVLCLFFLFMGILTFSGNGMFESPFIGLFAMLGVYGAMFLVLVPFFLPSLAVSVRRLHDTGRSGWYILLSFIPIVGLVIYFFLAQESSEGSNEYGENPHIEECKEYLSRVGYVFESKPRNMETPESEQIIL